jgi:hypothetical protein
MHSLGGAPQTQHTDEGTAREHKNTSTISTPSAFHLTSGAVMSMLKLNADNIRKNWFNSAQPRTDTHAAYAHHIPGELGISGISDAILTHA